MTTTTSNHPALSAFRPCACGCGRLTKSIWFPGDDARAKALLRSVARGETTIDALPGQLPEIGAALAVKWGLADEAGTWTAEASAPAKPNKNEPPALRHLRRAKEALGAEHPMASAVEALIATMVEGE